MAGYEMVIKTEELRKKVREGDYPSAQKILDTIDIRKVKNTADLSLMAEVFMQNGRYEEAYDIYYRVYNKTKTRTALFRLVYTAIKNNSIDEAVMYLSEYEKIAPDDFYIHIFRYQIDKRKGKPYKTLIEHLKALKEKEYIEQWAYELAKLYYKAGMEEECIRECSDIILWFGEGSYVEKARLLRAYYSGEADKDEILEELKRRAFQDTARWDLKDELKESQGEYRNNDINGNYGSDDTNADSITVVYSEDNAVNEVIENMKKDVEEILSGDGKNDQYADNTVQYGPDPDETETVQDAPAAGNEIQYESEEGNVIQYEYASEVEAELNRLIEEDDEGEYRRLKNIAEEYDFDLFEVFGNFLHVRQVRKQLANSLELILDKRTKSVQIIITGSTGSGKTELAKDISVFLYRTGKLKSSKIAKIAAEKLNSIDILKKKEVLKDCCLVVENASELKASAVNKLLDLIKFYRGDIAVIFEENRKNMNKLFRICPKLMELFSIRIHLPQYTEEELLCFAYAGIKQKDYRLMNGADKILKGALYDIIKEYEPEVQLGQIRKIIDAAMRSADLRMGKQLSGLAAQGKLGEAELLSILPEDFETKP